MKATRIKMKIGCAQSNNTTQISEIYVEGCTNPGYFAKESLYDYLKKNPDSIQVNIYPYPNLIPALSSNQEKKEVCRIIRFFLMGKITPSDRMLDLKFKSETE